MQVSEGDTDVAEVIDRLGSLDCRVEAIGEALVEPPGLAALRDHAPAMARALGADRITIFRCDHVERALVSVAQTGLPAYTPIKLPLAWETSIAAYCAARDQVVNVADVRDAAELSSWNPPLKWLHLVDERTGYRTKQLLCVPIRGRGRDVLGVLELVNSVDGKPFPSSIEEKAAALCPVLARLVAPDETRRISAIANELALAEDAFREDAPEPAARGRETILQRYRNRFYVTLGLDIWSSSRDRRAWGEEDFRGLEWLVRLADAGHVGALRLLQTVFGVHPDGRWRTHSDIVELVEARLLDWQRRYRVAATLLAAERKRS